MTTQPSTSHGLRWASRAGLLAAAVLVLVGAGCGNGGNGAITDSTTTTAQDGDFGKLHLVDDHLKSGSDFYVSYQPPRTLESAFQAQNVGLGITLGLYRGGRGISKLVVRDVSGIENLPAVLEPISFTPNRLMGEPGPFRFQLPELDPGRYEICIGVSYPTDPKADTFQHGKACTGLTIVD